MPLPTDIDWPEDQLGCPARAEYRSDALPMVSVIEVQDGPARYRIAQDEQRRDLQVSFLFTSAQVAVFEGFYHDTLTGGSSWFNLRIMTGLGMTSFVCHITGDVSIRPSSQDHNKLVYSFAVEAYAAGYVIPPAFAPLDPVDALTPGTVPADIYDARELLDPRPTDDINALSPGAYV